MNFAVAVRVLISNIVFRSFCYSLSGITFKTPSCSGYLRGSIGIAIRAEIGAVILSCHCYSGVSISNSSFSYDYFICRNINRIAFIVVIRVNGVGILGHAVFNVIVGVISCAVIVRIKTSRGIASLLRGGIGSFVDGGCVFIDKHSDFVSAAE